LITIFSFCLAFCAMLVFTAPIKNPSNIPVSQNTSDTQLDGNQIWVVTGNSNVDDQGKKTR
jgi:hypothetical protein